ncbi:MAG TPA: MFS transporter [Bacteroidota bacterium]|nr:MFS transporter [Bacteroidota bacterium]
MAFRNRPGPEKQSGFDWWLTGICLSRAFSGLIAMTYAAALPVLQKEWGMSAAAGGSVSSGYNIGYAISLVVLSSLADLVGPKVFFLGSMSGAAILSLAFGLFARNYVSALVLYSLVGVSVGGTYATGLMILADHYPAERRGMAIGFFIASTSLGYALSLIVSGIALPLGGYKLSFLLTCLGPLAGAILAWISLRKTHVSVERRQKQQRFVKEVLGNRPAMLLISGYTFHTWELLGMWAWTPAFLASCLAFSGGETTKVMGWSSYISAFFHLTGLIASFSMGMLFDRIGRARVIFMLSALSTLCSFVFGWSIGWPLIVVIGIGLIYGFSALGDSPVLSAALTEVVKTSYVGAAFGVRSLLGFCAGGLSPIVFGAVLDWTSPFAGGMHYKGWGWAYSVFGVGGLGAIAMAYFLGMAQPDRLRIIKR